MIRTRFAPSPTGYLHVGGLRTALYAYLFAKKNNGKLLLRIEDTDQERFVEGAQENLIRSLNFMGVHFDEGPTLDGTEVGEKGPYIQSKRKDIHTEYANKLIETGHAYRCFCTKERLDEMREKQKSTKEAPMYDRKCFNIPQSEIDANLAAGLPFVIRQKMPYANIKFKDIIRGTVQFDGKTIDDQVLVKSDGYPTYHLANVVDDHLMEITHVIRGEEWLPSTPKHIALYQAFGWEAPEFAHLPLLLNPDKTKLSKRQGDVSVESYIEKGYLKEAVLNFVAFLGWHPGGSEEKEIYSLEELEQIFTLEKVHKAGAVFNLEKLDWFNWKWRKAKFTEETANFTPEEKAKKLYEMCEKNLTDEVKKDLPKLYQILLTVEEKILRDPRETQDQIGFYFTMPSYEKELLTHEKMGVNLNQALEALKASQEALQQLPNWNEKELTETLTKVVAKLGFKNGQVFWPLRAALSGLQFSPGVFEVAVTLGKEETLSRIATAINKIEK